MKVQILTVLLLNLTISNLLAKDLEPLTGYVSPGINEVNGVKQVKFRTSNQDVILDYDKLDKKTKKLFSEPDTKKKEILTFDSAAIITKKNPPMGVRADCSEIPTSMDELGEIATKSKDMVDFLKNIPEGSLQGFTFVTNSLSLHRGKKDENGEGQVSPMWPRVLRSSADGKTTVSFVCDPKNPTFGKVEIMHFDDKTNEFKTTEFDFGHPSGPKVELDNRIHKDPKSCISCHAGSEINGKVSLKPNWPEYFQWSDCKENRGIKFYGGNDDNMGPGAYRYADTLNCNTVENQTSTKKEQDDFLAFREKQKNNECFNTLPWAKPEKDPGSIESQWSYKYYPYADKSQDSHPRAGDPANAKDYLNYSLRTNLRFTDTYSHLMSKRVAGLLKQSSNYDAVKYLLVMEQANCRVTEKEINSINNIVPGMNLKKEFIVKTPVNSQIGETAPLLYQFSKFAGLADKDWTMEFQEKSKTNYNAGMPNDRNKFGDLKIHDVVAGEILKDIGKDNQKIAKDSENRITRGVAQSFGKEFSCIDDLGGAILNSGGFSSPYEKADKTIVEKEKPEADLCKTLRQENAKNIQAIKKIQETCTDCKKINLPNVESKLPETIEEVVKKITKEQADRGKKLVEVDSRGKCVMCHSASVDMLPKDFRFIPADKDPNKAESMAVIKARKNEISGKLEDRLIKTKTMPPIDNELTDQDRQDIKAYLLSLAAGANK